MPHRYPDAVARVENQDGDRRQLAKKADGVMHFDATANMSCQRMTVRCTGFFCRGCQEIKRKNVLLQAPGRTQNFRDQGKSHALQKPEYCISTLVEKGKWGRDGTGFSTVAGLWSELTNERMTEDVRKVRSILFYGFEL